MTINDLLDIAHKADVKMRTIYNLADRHEAIGEIISDMKAELISAITDGRKEDTAEAYYKLNRYLEGLPEDLGE